MVEQTAIWSAKDIAEHHRCVLKHYSVLSKQVVELIRFGDDADLALYRLYLSEIVKAEKCFVLAALTLRAMRTGMEFEDASDLMWTKFYKCHFDAVKELIGFNCYDENGKRDSRLALKMHDRLNTYPL